MFYIGQSTVGMRRPLDHHRKGWRYEVEILESIADPGVQCEPLCPWLPLNRCPTRLNELERYWIALGRAFGWPLRNQTDGGEGVRPTPAVRARMSASHAGNRHTPESRARIRSAIRERFDNPEANKGNAKRKLSRDQVQEILGRREHGESRASVAGRFGVTPILVRHMECGRYYADIESFAGKRRRASRAVRVDLTGNRYGALLVLSRDLEAKLPGPVRWICRCDCGVVTSINGMCLKNGETRSCGCMRRVLAAQARQASSSSRLADSGTQLCLRGHMTERRGGVRVCRPCQALATAEYRKRKRAAVG